MHTQCLISMFFFIEQEALFIHIFGVFLCMTPKVLCKKPQTMYTILFTFFCLSKSTRQLTAAKTYFYSGLAIC